MYIVNVIFAIAFFALLYFTRNQGWTSHPRYDGEIVISITEDGKKIFRLDLAGDPEDLEKKDVVMFKIAEADIVKDE